MITLAENTENLVFVKNALQHKTWLVACLCAAWCDTCQSYRQQFNALAAQHPDKCFAWIDIEDQADLVDAVDIENFPTILIQYRDKAVFFGTMLPDTTQLNRLLNSFSSTLTEDDEAEICSNNSSLTQDIPRGWNLRHLILENR